MDPYSNPYKVPKNSLHNPFPHSRLSTREFTVSGKKGLYCGRGPKFLAYRVLGFCEVLEAGGFMVGFRV